MAAMSDALTTTDDMRHAAFNSRGLYLAGQDPQSLIQTLNDALNDIGDRTGSASAVAATSQSIQTGTLIFQGFFDTDNWDGELFAYEFLDGGVIGSTAWAASGNIPTENARNIFQALRSPAGEDLILEKNIFVERILTSSIMRTLSDEEMDEYRRPFANPGEDRRPTLTWPRQIPIEGEPADVTEIASAYAKWMATNDIPKLFIDAKPGSILTGKARDFALSFKNQTVVEAAGYHFLQEDSPDEIGEALSGWLKTL